MDRRKRDMCAEVFKADEHARQHFLNILNPALVYAQVASKTYIY